MLLADAIGGFWHGLLGPYLSRRDKIRAEKALREHLSEKQIDKMVEDSFPASDPPSTY